MLIHLDTENRHFLENGITGFSPASLELAVAPIQQYLTSQPPILLVQEFCSDFHQEDRCYHLSKSLRNSDRRLFPLL